MSVLLKKEEKIYTVEDTIPYLRMFSDGICQLDERRYSKTIAFQDINYQLALEEDRDLIFNQFANFLNSFDPSVHIELNYVNQMGRNKDLQDAIKIADKNDGYDEVRKEYREMLKMQLNKGNNGLKKMKFVTFTIEADNLDQAKANLNRLEVDILSNFKAMGVRAESLDGEERLRLIHDMLNPDEDFNFSYQDLKKKESTKSYITPKVFNFAPAEIFKFGKYIGSTTHFQILASELSDKMLSELLNIEDNIYIGFHIDVIEQTEAVKIIKRKNTDIDKMKIEEQKKAVRAGYDMDIIPSDINTYGNDVKSMLSDLQNRDERLFLVTIVIMNYARTIQKVEDTIAQISSIANKNNCQIKRLSHMQEQGLITVLPLGRNEIEIQRYLTSSSTAVLAGSASYLAARLSILESSADALSSAIALASSSILLALASILLKASILLLAPTTLEPTLLILSCALAAFTVALIAVLLASSEDISLTSLSCI